MVGNVTQSNIAEGDKNRIFWQGFDNQTSIREHLTSNACFMFQAMFSHLAILHLVTLPDSVDLLVDLGSVMVTLLTSSGHGVLDPARMPSSNTSDLKYESVLI